MELDFGKLVQVSSLRNVPPRVFARRIAALRSPIPAKSELLFPGERKLSRDAHALQSFSSFLQSKGHS